MGTSVEIFLYVIPFLGKYFLMFVFLWYGEKRIKRIIIIIIISLFSKVQVLILDVITLSYSTYIYICL